MRPAQVREIRAKTSHVIGPRHRGGRPSEHLVIRAPQDGVVHKITVHAKGAVISPGEPIPMIVKDQDRLVAEVRVAPATWTR